jgi:hypothetical protein
MTRMYAFLTFSVLLMPCLSRSQDVHDKCPEGLRYVGTLKGNGSFVEPLDRRAEITLPENATLDTSYQQDKVVADSGQRNARSDLRPQDIPKGIHIVPYGQNDLGKSWTVSDPKLKAVPETGGKTRYVFAMKLACSVTEYARQFGGCAVNVDVCYMPKK